MAAPFEIGKAGSEDPTPLPPPEWARYQRKLVVTADYPPGCREPALAFQNGGVRKVRARFTLVKQGLTMPSEVAAAVQELQEIDPDTGEPERVQLTLGQTEMVGWVTGCWLRYEAYNEDGEPSRITLTVELTAHDEDAP